MFFMKKAQKYLTYYTQWVLICATSTDSLIADKTRDVSNREQLVITLHQATEDIFFLLM